MTISARYFWDDFVLGERIPTSARLITEAESHGLRVLDYDHQGRFLTRLAAPWLATLEGHRLDAATLRQFQSLTHPAIMGRSFRCLWIEKDSD